VAYPNLTITFVIGFEGKYLLMKRSDTEKNFPALWAFPGGKVEEGETVIDAVRREVREETALEITDNFMLLNSYCFPGSVGLACLVQATSNCVQPEGFGDYRWVSSLSDMDELPCIQGIYNHLVDAIRETAKGQWRSMGEFNLRPEKYLNH